MTAASRTTIGEASYSDGKAKIDARLYSASSRLASVIWPICPARS